MVRLKAKEDTLFNKHAAVFQFQHGTIKSHHRIRLILPGWYFNSNMVRLKGLALGETSATAYRFQFQHGTIKRIRHHFSGRLIIYISIPTWYD